jgi:predicted nuclease of restriction endonuclease-like (RecB) superfamily
MKNVSLEVEQFANQEYIEFITDIKTRILNSQVKAAIKVNVELIRLYWQLGELIVQKQEHSKWGDGLIKQIETDLKLALPNTRGFSATNLKYIRQFYKFYSRSENILISQQLAGQIPWGHHMVILDKFKSPEIAVEYVNYRTPNSSKELWCGLPASLIVAHLS